MWAAGLGLLMIGYALAYTGIANLMNGGQGPKLWESLGFNSPIHGPGQTTESDTGSGIPGIDVIQVPVPGTGVTLPVPVPKIPGF